MVLLLQILYRRPGAPVDTVKFLGCGICDSARGSRVIGSRSSGGSKRTRSDGFGVQSAEDLYTELEALWRESLSECALKFINVAAVIVAAALGMPSMPQRQSV